MLAKNFSKDSFFSVSDHPTPIEYPPSAFQDVLFQLTSNDPEKGSGIPNRAGRSSLRNDSVSPKNPEFDQKPGFEEKPAFGGNPKPLDISDKGFEFLFRGLYKTIFGVLDTRFPQDMALTKKETDELVEATMPLAKKYASYDFKYGEEAFFGLALMGVFSKKFYSGTKTMDEKGKGKDILENLEDKSNQDTVAKGILSVLEEQKSEFANLPATELNDVEYQKVKNFILQMDTDRKTDVTRDEAGKFVSIIHNLGFDIDAIVEAVKTIGPENIRNLIERNAK